ASVFLVLPPDRLGTYSRWLRLMVAQAITDMARSPVQPSPPVLFLLDEFAALGPLEPVVRAYGLMAGYGMQLWAILQDLHQLKSLYGQRAGTFLSNAGVTPGLQRQRRRDRCLGLPHPRRHDRDLRDRLAGRHLRQGCALPRHA